MSDNTGEDDWVQVEPVEPEHNWVFITSLMEGAKYEVVVVAQDPESQTESTPVLINLGTKYQAETIIERSGAISSQRWHLW